MKHGEKYLQFVPLFIAVKDPETGGQTPPGHHIELVWRSHHLTEGPVELTVNLQGSLVVLGLL